MELMTKELMVVELMVEHEHLMVEELMVEQLMVEELMVEKLMVHLAPAHIRSELYVGDRNLTSREEVVELFANAATTYISSYLEWLPALIFSKIVLSVRMFSDIVAHVYQGEEEEGAEGHGQIDDGAVAVE